MDLAYDHIQEESFKKEDEPRVSTDSQKEPPPQATINEDFQEAYRAISSSPWGARIGGFLGSVVKQVGNLRRARGEFHANSPPLGRHSLP